MDRLIKLDKSVIIGADLSIDLYPELIHAISEVPAISAVKLGFRIGLRHLGEAVEITKKFSDLVTIYDHQKAGTDIPETGADFVEEMVAAGVDAAIIFPESGPVTQRAWVEGLQNAGIRVIGGGEMTHKGYLVSDGGYIADDAPERMYRLHSELGVQNFVVPGNKPEKVEKYRQLFEEIFGEGNFDLMAPGFIRQGGDISETGLVAGPRFHAIVASAVCKAGDRVAMREAAMKVTAQIAA